MNDKMIKLIALYNDKAISIEEKHTIAVKLIDMKMLEEPPQSQSSEKTAEFRIGGVRYSKNIRELFDLFKTEFEQRQELETKYRVIRDLNADTNEILYKTQKELIVYKILLFCSVLMVVLYVFKSFM